MASLALRVQREFVQLVESFMIFIAAFICAAPLSKYDLNSSSTSLVVPGLNR